MIESLHIEDLGVIEEADLEFGPGLTALTGETGAGKTMVLTSLGLLLGRRAEPAVVRTGAQRTLVEGSWTVEPGSRAARRAQEAGAELDEDLLLTSRTVPATGRSRAHLGGRSVPSAVLADVGSALVAVHGQADQLRLRSGAAQRAALDAFGGREHGVLCQDYAHAYRARREAADRLEQWVDGALARAVETALLRTWLERLEDVAPLPGEDRALQEEAARLDHAEDLRLAAGQARAALTGEEEVAGAPDADVVGLLATADRALASAAHHDPALAELAGRVHQLSYLAADVAADLTTYLAGIDADPARLAAVQDRRAELGRVLREISSVAEGVDDVDALLVWSHQAADRLADLDGPQDTGSRLAAALADADATLADAATRLTAARTEIAQRLSAAVTTELTGLEMTGARLVVELADLPEPGPTGAESVTLRLSAHPGAPALPLGKGASGGELSRIMLAIEVVLAENTDAGRRTFVFDEIDAGVGGHAALEVGRRLARLARTHQVVVVTHLAQVAAWADTQLVVVKDVDHVASAALSSGQDRGVSAASGRSTARTRTRVERVEGRERERELARMLSGHAESEAALRHAAELLAESGVAQSQT